MPMPATLFSPRDFPAVIEQWTDEPCFSAGDGRKRPAAVLQPWQQPVSAEMSTGTNTPLTGTVNTREHCSMLK